MQLNRKQKGSSQLHASERRQDSKKDPSRSKFLNSKESKNLANHKQDGFQTPLEMASTAA